MTTTPLVAGPEMDHLVATRVLGWTYEPRFEGDVAGYYHWRPLPHDQPRLTLRHISEEMPAYSTDLGACAPVLDWLKEQGGSVVLQAERTVPTWLCSMSKGARLLIEDGDTPAEAICRLALAVKEDAG